MCFEVRKIRYPFFSCQSLLLGTNVPNDKAEVLNLYFQSVVTRELDTELPDKGPSPYPSSYVKY